MADDEMRDVPSRYPGDTRLSDRLNLKKVSWGAIWAGAMVTLGMEILFLSFGFFINGAFGGSEGWTIAWYLITMAVAFYTGAASAARLSDISAREISILHALSTWGLATLATGLIGGVVGLVAIYHTGTPVADTTMFVHPEEWGCVIWVGTMLSVIASYMGGASAVPAGITAEQQAPSAPMRRVS